MSLNGGFNSLRLNSNVTLRDGGGAVLQKPLNKGNVVSVGLVDFRSIPLAKTVCADTFKAQIVTDDSKLFLNGTLCNGENQIFSGNAIPQTVVLHILSDHQRDGEHAPLACLLLHDFKVVSITVPNNVTGAKFHNVTDTQAQVSLQHKGGWLPIL